MDVVDWQNSPAPIVPKKRARQSFVSPALVGILGTLLLHGLILGSLPLGQGLNAKPPETLVPAGRDSKSKAATAENLVLITLPMTASAYPLYSQPSLFDLYKNRAEPPIKVEPPTLPILDTLALSEDQASVPEQDSGDAAERERLFGIYTGQIQARVNRIWRRPRSAVGDSSVESFQCQVQIVQDVHGNVQEILLPNCNGSASWQRSLVIAIEQASPLPAPPSASVFTPSVTLNFIAVPFGEGSSEDEYELAPRKLANTDASLRP
jgi:TonB C terminal